MVIFRLLSQNLPIHEGNHENLSVINSLKRTSL